ncbi:hypothetical protein DPMN_133694 [Dreissena polymorpha]|uniref:Uncharacterized protein n=1 Tax=Dreissena polymorpha TaxID=45954 RepID=A0A9D4FYD0_DREPO|nr:hypothetical protein DPMN_051876 [Dreissena polymorpha]KAH3770595.1 hypothetical protein DPMN_171884 [Dreissena polymorpha]KAH3776352.1 hypothetical protein DPMN_177774 [Dreissena polymorpha]KAH3805391.1 hypothetical protein DPMN_133694 [Dreissena polymorpha]
MSTYKVELILTVASETDLKTVIERATEDKMAFDVMGRELRFQDSDELKMLKEWCEGQGIKLI